MIVVVPKLEFGCVAPGIGTPVWVDDGGGGGVVQLVALLLLLLLLLFILELLDPGEIVLTKTDGLDADVVLIDGEFNTSFRVLTNKV